MATRDAYTGDSIANEKRRNKGRTCTGKRRVEVPIKNRVEVPIKNRVEAPIKKNKGSSPLEEITKITGSSPPKIYSTSNKKRNT